MKKLIKTLFFDREVVEAIKKTQPEILYAHLMSGKITMKEYVAARAGKR
jgi:hypothetical protein